MNLLRTLPSLIVVILGSTFGLLHADEQTTTHRIIGLFEPDRQDDLRQVMSAVPEVQLVSLDYDKAEAAFRYDVAQILPSAKKPQDQTPEKIAQKLNDLIREKSKGTFTLTAPSTLPTDQLTRLDFKIGILDCKGCRYGAYLVVAKLEGVEHATVSSETRTLTVWIDPAKTDRVALESALKKARVELPGPSEEGPKGK